MTITFWLMIFCCFTSSTNSIDQIPSFASPTEERPARGNTCFCQLSGTVDDCNCEVQSVDTFNNYKIYPILPTILPTDYFKYYKANLIKECPFWSDSAKCKKEQCKVSPCKEEDVPCGLRNAKQNNSESKKECACDKDDTQCHSQCKENLGASSSAYSREANEKNVCSSECIIETEEEERLGALDNSISDMSREAFESWQVHDDAKHDFCVPEDESSEHAEFYDLTINPERYTGYKGKAAHRIWNNIYKENCFKPDPQTPGYENFLNSKSLGGLCLEKRVFYRLISGLHSSINIHLCAKYLLAAGDGAFKQDVWGPNPKEFQRRFSPEKTGGEGPLRLKNLYFTYLVVLRAIAKASPYFKQETFYTGVEARDVEVKNVVLKIAMLAEKFPNHFNESAMFTGKEAHNLKEEFRKHFWNISRIMDCVDCTKCRLWGKLQIQGLGTALKILFSEKEIGKPGSSFMLKRHEIVALFNGFAALSYSVNQIEEFKKLTSKPTTGSKIPVSNMNGSW
ncbi:ERO1-like protein alpha isoform X2 [Anneissia japonica]|uniref:ERO1-like protein alpha isoform X2 n=1 Tax=Anneissia japonica TaxID=1529436 RepID=UPI0014255586|nr:ERO1-like protein alpha isoform X2 [Anneissia japonica]